MFQHKKNKFSSSSCFWLDNFVSVIKECKPFRKYLFMFHHLNVCLCVCVWKANTRKLKTFHRTKKKFTFFKKLFFRFQTFSNGILKFENLTSFQINRKLIFNVQLKILWLEICFDGSFLISDVTGWTDEESNGGWGFNDWKILWSLAGGVVGDCRFMSSSLVYALSAARNFKTPKRMMMRRREGGGKRCQIE